MNPLKEVLWLGGQAMSVLEMAWPVTLVVLLVLGGAVIWDRPRFATARDWRPLILAVFPLALLAWGALAAHEDPTSLAPTWPFIVLVLVLVVQIIVTTVIIYTSRGHRYFATAVGAVVGWYSLACAFLSGMAVTGDWV